jgi:hypothetical protein
LCCKGVDLQITVGTMTKEELDKQIAELQDKRKDFVVQISVVKKGDVKHG